MKGKVGKLTLPNFKTYYKMTVIETVLLVSPISGTELKVQNKPIQCHQLIFDKNGKTAQWRKRVSSMNSAGTTEYLYTEYNWILTSHHI